MLNILLIEDEEIIKEKLTFLLEGLAGVVISTAPNFKQALTILIDQPNTNLIVADYRSAHPKELEKIGRAHV